MKKNQGRPRARRAGGPKRGPWLRGPQDAPAQRGAGPQVPDARGGPSGVLWSAGAGSAGRVRRGRWARGAWPPPPRPSRGRRDVYPPDRGAAGGGAELGADGPPLGSLRPAWPSAGWEPAPGAPAGRRGRGADSSGPRTAASGPAGLSAAPPARPPRAGARKAPGLLVSGCGSRAERGGLIVVAGTSCGARATLAEATAVTKRLRGPGGGNRSLISGPEQLRRSPASRLPAGAHWRRRAHVPRGLVGPSCAARGSADPCESRCVAARVAAAGRGGSRGTRADGGGGGIARRLPTWAGDSVTGREGKVEN